MGEIVMLKLAYFCAATVIVISVSRVADAQTAPQIPNYQSPGVYSTYGNQTYGPHGELQTNQGNQTYTEGPKGRGPTYSTYGHQTYGSDHSMYDTYGNTTYGSDRSVSQTQGNVTTTYRPDGRTVVCAVYGNQTVCK